MGQCVSKEEVALACACSVFPGKAPKANPANAASKQRYSAIEPSSEQCTVLDSSSFDNNPIVKDPPVSSVESPPSGAWHVVGKFDVEAPKKEESVPRSAEIKRPEKGEDILSSSLHRRRTLQYISSRRQELVRAASLRCFAASEETPGKQQEKREASSMVSDQPTKDAKSKEAIRMPNRRPNGRPAPLLRRQNSWFTLGLCSDSLSTSSDEEENEKKQDTMEESFTDLMDMSSSYPLHGSATNHSSWGDIGMMMAGDADIVTGSSDTFPLRRQARRTMSLPAEAIFANSKNMMVTAD